ELGDFPELKEIRIVNGNLNSLEGIQAYDKLRDITVAYARSLTELGKHSWDFKALESLSISNCKKLSPDSFSKLPSLKNFEFSDCGPVPTLEWIPKFMPQLEDLNFWGTKPEDGDLSFVKELKNLKNIHFKDEKHYNAKCKDLKESVKNNKDLSAVITGAPAITIEKDKTLPTSEWKKQGFSDEQVKKVDDILNKFIKDIGEAKSEDQKIKAFEVAVKALDKMQLNNDYFLDTLCREDLVNFFNEKAHEHGLDQFDDITWEWREEW
ncbi:MAG: hypothetical protein ACPF9D_10890, partial [Owenweeksia sp.]